MFSYHYFIFLACLVVQAYLATNQNFIAMNMGSSDVDMLKVKDMGLKIKPPLFFECAKCHKIENGDWVQLPCRCQFHYSCIKNDFVCFNCKKTSWIEIGCQPLGIFSANLVTYPVNLKRIQINVDFMEGIQNSTHPNPGQYHHGGAFKIELPNTQDHKKICEKLRTLFHEGLLYSVGNDGHIKENRIVRKILSRKNDLENNPQKLIYLFDAFFAFLP